VLAPSIIVEGVNPVPLRFARSLHGWPPTMVDDADVIVIVETGNVLLVLPPTRVTRVLQSGLTDRVHTHKGSRLAPCHPERV